MHMSVGPIQCISAGKILICKWDCYQILGCSTSKANMECILKCKHSRCMLDSVKHCCGVDSDKDVTGWSVCQTNVGQWIEAEVLQLLCEVWDPCQSEGPSVISWGWQQGNPHTHSAQAFMPWCLAVGWHAAPDGCALATMTVPLSC